MAKVSVGIMTEAKPIIEKGHMVWPESSYAHLARLISPTRARFFLFHPMDLDVRRRTARGWTWDNRRDRWIQSHFSAPDVIYNRISRRNTEQLKAYRLFLRRLLPHIPLFNLRFLQKDEVHHALTSSPVSSHWPLTEIGHHRCRIAEIVDTWNDVYLKPVGGSLGRGITRIVRQKDGYTFWRVSRPGHPSKKGHIPRRRLPRALRRWFGRESFLIQKTVYPCEIDNRPFDVRILMQRTPDDRWSLTGIAGRIGHRNTITTHIPRGGEGMDFASLIQACPRLPTAECLGRICSEALTAFEDATGLYLFEASFDVAVNKAGHPYILEINSRPFPFDEPDVQRKAAESLLKYAAEGPVEKMIGQTGLDP